MPFEIIAVAHDVVCNMVIIHRNLFSSIIAQGQASAYYFKGVQIGKENWYSPMHDSWYSINLIATLEYQLINLLILIASQINHSFCHSKIYVYTTNSIEMLDKLKWLNEVQHKLSSQYCFISFRNIKILAQCKSDD